MPHNEYDFPQVGCVTYELHKDWLNKTDAVYITRVEVVAHCKNRKAARRWMLTRPDEGGED